MFGQVKSGQIDSNGRQTVQCRLASAFRCKRVGAPPEEKKKSFAKIQMDVSRIPELQNSRVRIDQFGRFLGSLRNTHMTVIGCACVCVCVCACVCVCLIQDASSNSNPPWEKM